MKKPNVCFSEPKVWQGEASSALGQETEDVAQHGGIMAWWTNTIYLVWNMTFTALPCVSTRYTTCLLQLALRLFRIVSTLGQRLKYCMTILQRDQAPGPAISGAAGGLVSTNANKGTPCWMWCAAQPRFAVTLCDDLWWFSGHVFSIYTVIV